MNKVIRPHSFQAADLHSAADQAGAPVVDGSGAPASPFDRQDKINAYRKQQVAEANLSHVTPATPHSEYAANMHKAMDEIREIFGEPPVRRKPAIYGYDSHDVEAALRGIECALPFALAAFRCHLENNEHVASFVDFEGFADRLTDLVADELRGPLMRRLDEMRGNR